MAGSANAQLINLAVDDSGSFTTSLGTVTFTFDQMQPTGTGVLDPFLRIQRNFDEQGYNTTQPNDPAMPFQEKSGPWTHDVTIASLEDHDGDGTYEFVLDIGEPVNANSSSLLTLDGLKLFSTDTPSQNGDAVDGLGNWVGPTGTSTLLWDMDEGLDRTVLLDANRDGNPGNGVSDMIMDVNTSIIDDFAGEQYFILWSRFGLGENEGETSFGTFEEWSQVKVPEPSTYGLIGAGALVLLIAARKFKKKA